jgi:hypothetical protein
MKNPDFISYVSGEYKLDYSRVEVAAKARQWPMKL